MKNLLPVLALGGLSLFNHAEADRTVDNLKNISSTDLCSPFSAFVYIDSKLDNSKSQSLTQIMADQNALFGYPFARQIPLGCSISSYFAIEALTTANGSYVYTYSLVVYAPDGSLSTSGGSIPAKLITFYDNGGFGIAPNQAVFIDKLNDYVKEMFQDFLLDWRKTH